MRQHRHLGAYGLLREDGRILLIRKARGPYTGQWDLPGGRIEFGESPEDTVRRELQEEAGLTVAVGTLLSVVSERRSYRAPDGEEEELHHIGIIYEVAAEPRGVLRCGPDGQDSLGAEWFEEAGLPEGELSPMVRGALGALPGASSRRPG